LTHPVEKHEYKNGFCGWRWDGHEKKLWEWDMDLDKIIYYVIFYHQQQQRRVVI